jgi:hypothetical protein
MKIPNPNNPIFVQKNNGVRDITANIAGSFGIDFARRPGKAMPAPRMMQSTNNTDDVDLTTRLNSIVYYDEKYWGVADNVWKSPTLDPTGVWTQDAITDTPSASGTYSDMVVFNNQMVVSVSRNVAMFNGTTWDPDWYTSVCTGATLVSAKMHPMAVVNIGSPMLCIGNDYYLATVTGGTTGNSQKLTLDTTQRIRWIVGGNSRVYIGTINVAENIGHSYVYEWDGGDTVPTRAYKLQSRGTLSGVMHEDTLYTVDSDGALLRLEGGGLKRVAQFPVYNTRYTTPGLDDIEYLGGGFVGHKGMLSFRGKVLILADPSAGETDELPEYGGAGIWEYNPDTGSFTNKHVITLDKTGSVDFGQRRLAGTSLDETPGALFEARYSASNDGAQLVASSGYYTNSSSTGIGIFYDDIVGGSDRRGSLVTNQIHAPDTSHNWEIRLKYEPMKNAGDSIVLKYRTREDPNLPFTATSTWTDANTFTTTDTSCANVVVGNECEVIQGDGGGCRAHVTNISYANPTYTIDLDESITGIAGTETGKVRFHNWKKLDSFNDQLVGYRKYTVPSSSSAWIQVLVELRSDGGDSPILEEIDIIPTKQQ